jgi:RND family efflux transporter MFP subunit
MSIILIYLSRKPVYLCITGNGFMSQRTSLPKFNFFKPLLLSAIMSLPAQSLADTPLPVVKVLQPEQREVIDYQEFTGRFEAVQSVELRARVPGYLDAIHFRDGQLVKKGDLLFEIDPRPYRAALARAKAELSRSESQLSLSDVELKRGENLLGGQAISAEEVDTRRARFQEANANVAAAKAAVQTAELDLQYASIRAPVDGRISSRNIDVGNLIATNDMGQPLTTLVSLNPLHFVFDVSEGEYLRYIRLAGGEAALNGDSGIVAKIKLLDEDNFTHEGTVDFVDNRLDQNTATLRMRVLVDNEDEILRPGLFGRVQMAFAPPYEALLIPDKAVLSDQTAKIVMIVNDEGIVEVRPVETGPLQDDLRVINTGLQGDERVIVEGLLRARPSSEVDAQPLNDDKSEK